VIDFAGDAFEYEPGVCNIGPPEIARRRRSGHVGLAVTAVVLAGLALVKAPPIARLVVALPAAAAASGYLQARLGFCAGFASRGVFNFGEIGSTFAVADAEARAADRTKAILIGAGSAAIGAVVGLGAVLLSR
jgi:hypothetical protein